MTNNFITNSQESIILRECLKKLINVSTELKFLAGFFYFSGWQQYQIDGIKKSVIDHVLQRKLIEQVKRQFKEKNADYGRKLYLIEKCIYGVDIQQIAVEIALEKRAANSLKSLLKQSKDELNQTLISFIDTLLKDIKRYKTLPKYTLRKLILLEKNNNNPYKELIQNIEELRRKIGNDYLEIILKRISNIDDDIIIAVENRKEEEYTT